MLIVLSGDIISMDVMNKLYTSGVSYGMVWVLVMGGIFTFVVFTVCWVLFYETWVNYDGIKLGGIFFLALLILSLIIAWIGYTLLNLKEISKEDLSILINLFTSLGILAVAAHGGMKACKKLEHIAKSIEIEFEERSQKLRSTQNNSKGER